MRAFLLSLLIAWTANAACTPPPNTYDIFADTWRNQVLATGTPLSAAAYRAGTVFMQQTGWWGVRPYLKRVNLYLGGTTNAMLIPIIRDWFSSSDQSDSLVAFASTDFDETVGLTGNTTSKYLRCNGTPGLNLNGLTVSTNLHLSAYVRTSTNEASFTMGVQTGTTIPLFYLFVSSTGVQTSTQLGSTAIAVYTDTTGVGFFVATRRSTTDLALFKNGVVQATDATSDTGVISSVDMVVHALNQGGTPALFTSRTLSFYGIGLTIPVALEKPYYDAVQNVQIRMARQK